MKRLFYIMTVLSCLACNSGYEADKLKNSEAMEAEETTVAEEKAAAPAVNYDVLALQKLRDYADLLSLEAKHPDFAGEVAAGLKAIAADRIIKAELSDSVRIDAMVALGPAEIVSDSIQKIRYRYTLVSGKVTLTDTITAVIIKRKVQFDDEEVFAYKLTFERNE